MSDRSSPKLTYLPALDGIRAVSIIGIMANHGGLAWADGGFISVNVFFVLSGYLITSLLVKEHATRGAIRLSQFWARRARRLLPALFFLLAGIATYAILLAPPDTLATLRADALATLLYVANWHQILAGQSYFAQAAATSPLLHTWTLAIEEQFYLVWPLVVIAGLAWTARRARRRGSDPSLPPLAFACLLAAMASAAEMALLFHPGSDPSRVYYGTDTRAQDLLTGAALAFLLARRNRQTETGESVPSSSRLLTPTSAATIAGCVGVVGFALEWSRLSGGSAFPYRGGFLLADLLTAAVIFGIACHSHGPVSRVLSFRPLAYVGTISYALYLWHWPVFVVLDARRCGLGGYPLFALRAAVSLLLAAVSSHFLEMPIRRGALSTHRARLAAPLGAAATGLVVVLATSLPAGGASVPTVDARSAVQHSGGANPAAWPPVLGPAPPAASFGPGPYFDLSTYGDLSPDPARLSRVLLVGDSVSLTLFLGLYKDAARAGLALIPRGVVGCGLSTVTPVQVKGVDGDPFPECPGWPSWWHTDLAYYRPSVVCIISGYWEVVNRFFQGRWQHLGDPDFDAYVAGELEKAISLASSTGAKVALFTSPYIDNGERPGGGAWPESDPSRVDTYNRLVTEVAARHSGTVSVVPFGSWLDPGGHFTETIDGVTVRGSDGVHTTVAGDAYLAPKLLPVLARLAGAGAAGGVSRSGEDPASAGR